MKFKTQKAKRKTTAQNSKASRIIDVNANRAVEGLRVMEEVARFVLENKRISVQLKNIRSKLRRSIDRLAKGDVHFKHRKALRDIGRKVYTRKESKRSSILDIYVANAKRVEEALRVLEEFSKLIGPQHGKVFKDIRFRVYALEKRGFRALGQSGSL